MFCPKAVERIHENKENKCSCQNMKGDFLQKILPNALIQGLDLYCLFSQIYALCYSLDNSLKFGQMSKL